jgi:hypothetical protein
LAATLAKRWTQTLVVGATLFLLVAAGIASAEKPVKVQAGDVIVSFNAGIRPKRLPKSQPAPVTLSFASNVATASGNQPPQLRTIVLEADKNISVNAKGLPVCALGKLRRQDTKGAKRACAKAIVGSGRMSARVQFPESAPFISKSTLLAFNGGSRGGKTRILLHAYLSSPVPAAVVTVLKVSKIHKGRLGLRFVASVPTDAGGSRSTVGFRLKIGRNFTYRGKRQGYLLAKCPDGHLDFLGTAVFQGAPSVSARTNRSCTRKG